MVGTLGGWAGRAGDEGFAELVRKFGDIGRQHLFEDVSDAGGGAVAVVDQICGEAIEGAVALLREGDNAGPGCSAGEVLIGPPLFGHLGDPGPWERSAV